MEVVLPCFHPSLCAELKERMVPAVTPTPFLAFRFSHPIPLNFMTYGDRLTDLIDTTYATEKAKVEDGMRHHLGASIIGDSCMRYLWYTFRWVDSEAWIGRMLRLVERGQREEDVFIFHLRRIGAKVYTHDNKGEQYRISFLGDHFAGSTDGVATDLPELDEQALVLEFKTHNQKHFTNLKAQGVAASHPKHFKQAQMYMKGFGLKRALYCGLNKNTEDLHFELLNYEPLIAEHLVAKAESIIFGEGIPPKISASPLWFECRFCTLHSVCHMGKAPRQNCRTCQHSKPEREGGWSCGLGQPEITTMPKVGCQNYQLMEELR